MNTKQLAVLWYAVLILTGYLFVEWRSAPFGEDPSPFLLPIIIVLVAGTAIYTLSSQVQADRKRIAQVVGIPILVGAAVWGLNKWSKNWTVGVPVSQVEIKDARMDKPSSSGYADRPSATIKADIHNKSDRKLEGIVVTITVRDSEGEVLERSPDTLHVEVMPGVRTQIRSGVSFGKDLVVPDNWRWTFSTEKILAHFRD